jgi:hypothetical protein
MKKIWRIIFAAKVVRLSYVQNGDGVLVVYLLPNEIRPNVFYDTMYMCRALRGPGPKRGEWGSRGARVAGLGWVQLPPVGPVRAGLGPWTALER